MTPVEAGLLFTCKLKSDIAFIGREAVEKIKSDGPRRKLASFAIEDPSLMMWGGELVLRDGAAVGQVTSAAYGGDGRRLRRAGLRVVAATAPRSMPPT